MGVLGVPSCCMLPCASMAAVFPALFFRGGGRPFPSHPVAWRAGTRLVTAAPARAVPRPPRVFCGRPSPSAASPRHVHPPRSVQRRAAGVLARGHCRPRGRLSAPTVSQPRVTRFTQIFPIPPARHGDQVDPALDARHEVGSAPSAPHDRGRPHSRAASTAAAVFERPTRRRCWKPPLGCVGPPGGHPPAARTARPARLSPERRGGRGGPSAPPV